MTTTQDTFFNKPVIIFSLSLLLALFWLSGSVVNVYGSKLTGAIFEILWFPMIVMLLVLPVLAIRNWIKQKFKPASLYPWSLLLIATAVVMLLVRK